MSSGTWHRRTPRRNEPATVRPAGSPAGADEQDRRRAGCDRARPSRAQPPPGGRLHRSRCVKLPPYQQAIRLLAGVKAVGHLAVEVDEVARALAPSLPRLKYTLRRHEWIGRPFDHLDARCRHHLRWCCLSSKPRPRASLPAITPRMWRVHVQLVRRHSAEPSHEPADEPTVLVSARHVVARVREGLEDVRVDRRLGRAVPRRRQKAQPARPAPPGRSPPSMIALISSVKPAGRSGCPRRAAPGARPPR